MGKGNKIPQYILELESQGWGGPGRVEVLWEITLCSLDLGMGSQSPEPGNTPGK